MPKPDFIILDDPCDQPGFIPPTKEEINRFWDECVTRRLSANIHVSTNAENAKISENT